MRAVPRVVESLLEPDPESSQDHRQRCARKKRGMPRSNAFLAATPSGVVP
jgi:hypothetical protein